MKQFTSTLAMIKNKNGKYEPLPAIRGATPYEIAVRNGFNGTEDEWYNLSFDEGWVTKYQRLEADKANKDEVYTSEEVDGLLQEVMNDTDEMVAQMAMLRYALLSANVSSAMNDLALGINIENEKYIGRVLAMWAGDTNAMYGTSETFPTLVGVDSIDDIDETITAEMLNNVTMSEKIYNYETLKQKIYLDNAKNSADYELNIDSYSIDYNSSMSNINMTVSGYTATLRFSYNYDGSGVDSLGARSFKTTSIPTNDAELLNFKAKYNMMNRSPSSKCMLYVYDADTDDELTCITLYDEVIPVNADDKIISVDITGVASVYFVMDFPDTSDHIVTGGTETIALKDMVLANYKFSHLTYTEV